MAKGKKGTKGVKIQPTVADETPDVADGLARTVGLAAGESLGKNDVLARAVYAGLLELARCPACSTGAARCDAHRPEVMLGGLAVLRLDQRIGLQKAAQDGIDHRALVDYFWIKWERAEGQKPIMSLGDGLAFKRLRIAAGGLEQAKRIIDRAFEIERDGKYRTIQSIEKNPMRYMTGRRSATSTLQREPEADFLP